jgi:hypothetical protein
MPVLWYAVVNNQKFFDAAAKNLTLAPAPKVKHHCQFKMSHAMINTLLDAFEMKIRSERALAEHRLQAELTNLRQSLLSVLPQNRSVTNYEINALQEEQQMLRDMVSELQDSLESMSRRFISSRLSVGSLEHKINTDDSSDNEDDCDDAVVEVSRVSVLKNEIVYPSIHVEKQNHVPDSEDEESEEEAPPAVVKKPATSAPVKKPAPAPEPESEEEESEEEAPVPVKKAAAPITPAKRPAPEPEPESEEEEEEEEGPDVSVPEEEEEAELEEFTFKGKTYYKDDENNVYNDDGDLIGRKVGASVVFNKK